MDNANKILVSSSWDSDVQIWKEKGKSKAKNKETSEEDLSLEPKSHSVVRSIKNNHFGK